MELAFFIFISEQNLEMGAATKDFVAEMKQFMEKHAKTIATPATTAELQTAAMEAMKEELCSLKEKHKEEVKIQTAERKRWKADVAQRVDGLIYHEGGGERGETSDTHAWVYQSDKRGNVIRFVPYNQNLGLHQNPRSANLAGL